ncbi:hypothetical protein EV424DRAFT_1326828 [Suillus variegatus]|nr:hypothetical protein EV424DRAFT_1326828 [Suillus variegatus]
MGDDFRVFKPERVVIFPQQGQANNFLHNIRVHLADKADIFRKIVRVVKSQSTSSRAWSQVHSMDRAVSIYSKCRSQLYKLGANDVLLKRYQPLAKEHLKVSTALANPNSQGQRNNMLAWFWSLDVEGDFDSSDWLNEFYHVHWLHAKVLRDHWAKEILQVKHEMQWTCNFFAQKAEE